MPQENWYSTAGGGEGVRVPLTEGVGGWCVCGGGGGMCVCMVSVEFVIFQHNYQALLSQRRYVNKPFSYEGYIIILVLRVNAVESCPGLLTPVFVACSTNMGL